VRFACARGALQSLRSSRFPPPRYRHGFSLFGLASRSESVARSGSGLSVCRTRYAVGLFVGSAVFPCSSPTDNDQRYRRSLSSSLSLRLKQPGQHLVDLTPTPLLSSLLPSAHEGTKVHLPRALPARYVPPSGFGYPLGGFLPSNPCQLCFTPAALLGFSLRSFPLSEGTHRVSAANPPTYRFPSR
jgi:hypothetical protein